MRLRTQLVLAAFVLAVVPLAAIVVYSYETSRKALESAYHLEAARATRQMDRRLTAIRAELEDGLNAASTLSSSSAPAQTDNATPDIDAIVRQIADSASLVEAVEFQPVEPPDAPFAPPASMIRVDVPTMREPMIIDIPHFKIPEAQKELVREIRRQSRALALNAGTMTPEQRQAEEAKLEALNERFNQEMDAASRDYSARLDRARQHAERPDANGNLPQPKLAEPPAPPAPPAPVVAVHAAPSPAPKVFINKRRISADELARLRARQKQIALILGRKFNVPVKKKGEVVGSIAPKISTEEVIRRVLGTPGEDDIAFAVDREGNVYTRSAADRATLERIGVMTRITGGRSLRDLDNWIVVLQKDEESGLRVGVARPVGENLIELRNTAARNFSWGLALVGFALIGIVPFANHITRDINLVTDGAERIAQGDLMTRLPVKSKNEVGQLASAFNRMAEDLSVHQQKLVEQERFAVEYARKTIELEDARRFQLSMLPKEMPHHPRYDVAAFSVTATEVGGDYYDFHVAADGSMAVTIGDATGHGAKAGTMVTVIKTLFAGYQPAIAPALFLRDAAEKIKRMDLGRMAMALSLARFADDGMTIASAGMPPALVHRAATGEVEEIAFAATPLGTLGIEYDQREVVLASGDTVLLLTDGFPELQNEAGQQLGYVGALEEFAAAATKGSAAEVIAALADAAHNWHGEQPPNDDITFVVVRLV